MCGLIDEYKIEEKLAKSNGQTIKQHNESLFEALKLLKSRIGLNDDIEYYLKLAIKYHDYGKAYEEFQKKIGNKTYNELLLHHLISPIFYILSKTTITEIDKVIVNAIFRHHSRQLELIEAVKVNFKNNTLRSNLEKIYNNIESCFKSCFNREFDYKSIISKYLTIILNSNDYFPTQKKYILTTGLLIRLDHAASGELEVEEEPIKEDRKELLFSYFEKQSKPKQLRPFQQTFGIDRRTNYQCIVADTGLGKTALSVLWSQRKKFYILPNRASVNAMYNTLKEIYGEEKVGLLHSTSLFHLLTDYEDDISVLKQYDQTRVLSKPVTVCTADQLFTAAFNMPGYEKIYATLSYSDVIIDEIQGFQPQQIIPILKQIRETKELGTRYLIITATLPDIVAKKLCEYGFCIIENDSTTIDITKRHKVKIEDKKIEDLVDEMIAKCKNNKKILVVTNTVKKAQEVYKAIKGKLTSNDETLPNILHSRFIWKDRQEKEKAILAACEQDQNGNYKNPHGCIWVCTQLVEASLDIDFDYLFTEASTADSLIQRMGRVWRHRNRDYDGDENVIIATNIEYRIYEEILVKKSIEMIQKKLSEGFLLSQSKREIVKELYSEKNLDEWKSEYLSEWEEYERKINSGWNFILEVEGQRAFRDVMTIELIPYIYEEKIKKKMEELINLNNSNADKKQKRLEKTRILKEIQEYKVPVPIYLVNPRVSEKIINSPKPIEWLDKEYEIGVLNENYEYDRVLGLTGKAIEAEEESNISNNII